MQPLSDRTAGFTDSVIRRMTRISNQYGAVNLSQASRILTRPKQFWTVWPRSRTRTTTSTPSPGARRTSGRRLAAKQTRYMGRTIDPNSEIVVTCGSTEAMMTAMMTVTNPGGQGRYLLAVLRELRRGHDPDRGRANLCAADAAGIYL